jgi:hypothetical protein
MDHEPTARTRISGSVDVSRRQALSILGVLSVVFLLAVALAPAPISFALTLGLATAWCIWLEKHPEALDVDMPIDK